MPAVPQAALDLLQHIPFANHIHGGATCTAESHDPSCEKHPGALVNCHEFHIPFFGTVHSCLHHVDG